MASDLHVHHHGHGRLDGDREAERHPLRTRRGLTIFLWAAVVVILGSAAGGVYTLWPRHAPTAVGRLPTDSVRADTVAAVVLSVAHQVCPGTTVAPSSGSGSGSGSGSTSGTTKSTDAADRAIDQALNLATQETSGGGDDQSVSSAGGTGTTGGTGASSASGGDDAGLVTQTSCVMARTRLEAGPDAGSIEEIPVPAQVLSGGLSPGQRVTVARFAAQPGAAATYGWVDYARGRPLALLAVAFLVVVLLVARWRGITAIAGLGLGYLTIMEFILPALRAGRSPLAVALCGAVLIMVVILYIAHGVTAKTTTALLGTVFGLTTAGALAWWASGAAHLNGLSNDDNLSLTSLPGGGLRGVILCGLVLASLGVLNDVTVTQASAVWEIATHAPHLHTRGLFASGMRVGRDHLASTVYTIAFAYAGAALPTLMMVEVFSTPWSQVVTSEQIAEEVVRTFVGAIGLVLAIPVTTLIAAVVVTLGTRRTEPHLDATAPTPGPLLLPGLDADVEIATDVDVAGVGTAADLGTATGAGAAGAEAAAERV